MHATTDQSGVLPIHALLRIALAIIVLCGEPAASLAADAPGNFITDQQALLDAVAMVQARMGSAVQAREVRIEPRQLWIEAQDPKHPTRVYTWRFMRHADRTVDVRKHRTWDFSRVSNDTWYRPIYGRRRTLRGMGTDPLAGRLFALSGINFARSAAVAEAALKRAALDSPAAVKSMSIEQATWQTPEGHRDRIRWTIDVRSEGERAAIYADAKGTIKGVDVDQTNRARRLNLLERPDLLAEAGRAMGQSLGKRALVEWVSVGPHGVYARIRRDGHLRQAFRYTWDLNGLSLSANACSCDAAPNPLPKLFRVQDVDLALLPHLVDRSRDLLDAPRGETSVTISRKIDAVLLDGSSGTSDDRKSARARIPILWDVAIGIRGWEAQFQGGRVLFDAGGTLVEVQPAPPSNPRQDWLSSETIGSAVRLVERELGASRRFDSILVREDNLEVGLADAKSRRRFVRLLSYGGAFKNSGTGFDPGLPHRSVRSFRAHDLTALQGGVVETMAAKALSQLGKRMEYPSVIAIKLRSDFRRAPSRRGILVEIRVAGLNAEGWARLDLDGRFIGMRSWRVPGPSF